MVLNFHFKNGGGGEGREAVNISFEASFGKKKKKAKEEEENDVASKEKEMCVGGYIRHWGL